jgi:hypothetical protein
MLARLGPNFVTRDIATRVWMKMRGAALKKNAERIAMVTDLASMFA